jgi:class 3 adenylate cyclase
MSTPKETKESAVADERQFCFMSVDMVGHTLLTANLPHRAIYDIMNAFHEWIERDVSKEKGEVWSWAGDGALCAFGPGFPDPTAKTLACVRAAMEILDSLPRFNERREETRKTPVRLRVACHLGYARDLPQRGKVFSDAVNFSSAPRARGHTREQHLYISGDLQGASSKGAEQISARREFLRR